jgi:transposase
VQYALRKSEWPQYGNDGIPLVAFPDPGVCPSQEQYGLYPNKYTQRYEVTARRDTNDAWRAVPAHTMYEVVYRVEKAWEDARIETQLRRAANPARIAKGLEPLPDAKARWAKKPADVGLPFTRGVLGDIETEGKYAFVVVANAGKLGQFKLRYHRPLPDGAIIKQAYITREVDGWYISLSCQIPTPEPLPETGHSVGVDLNCIHQGDNQDIAALSDGRIYSTPDNLKKEAAKLAHLNKMVSNRRTRGTAKHADPKSNRTKKRREQIDRKHQKIARQREHDLHYIANRIVDTADEIKFENVNWANLRRQGTPREEGDNRQGGRKANKGRNRSMSTASPGKLRETTQQKADAAGRNCGEVSARNTSKACSSCGAILAEMTAATREWTCPECGMHHNRDVNAAQNIQGREFVTRKRKKAAKNYKPRRNGRNHSNPSALGDMPGEGLPERSSVNLESTGRKSTGASASENARIPNKESRAEVQTQNPEPARSEQHAQKTQQGHGKRRKRGAIQLSLDL